MQKNENTQLQKLIVKAIKKKKIFKKRKNNNIIFFETKYKNFELHIIKKNECLLIEKKIYVSQKI